MPHRLLAALAVLPFGLAACSLSSDPAADSVGKAAHASDAHDGEEAAEILQPVKAGAPALTFRAAATELRFEPETAKAEAGVTNIRFVTDGSHNLALAGPGIIEAVLWGDPAGRPVDVTHAVELTAGRYKFYCSVPGHAGAGMTGTITVA